jgi:hypothetical protein
MLSEKSTPCYASSWRLDLFFVRTNGLDSPGAAFINFNQRRWLSMSERGKAECSLVGAMRKIFLATSAEVVTEEKLIGVNETMVRKWKAFPSLEFCLQPAKVSFGQAHYLILRWPGGSSGLAGLYKYRAKGVAEQGFWIECRDLDSIRGKWGERSTFLPSPSLPIVASAVYRSKKDPAAVGKMLGWSADKVERIKACHKSGTYESIGHVENSLPDWAQLRRVGKLEPHETEWAVSSLPQIVQDVDAQGTLEFIDRVLALPRDVLPLERRDDRVDELNALRSFLCDRARMITAT